MNEFLQKAEAELLFLQTELGSLSDRQRVIGTKIQALKAYIAAENTSQPELLIPEIRANGKVIRFFGPRSTTIKQSIIDTTRELLEKQDAVKTEEILEKLSNDNKIPATTTAASVSSILSRDGHFVANRKHGWKLAKKESLASNEAPDPQPTP